jgi:hypothetical protein
MSELHVIYDENGKLLGMSDKKDDAEKLVNKLKLDEVLDKMKVNKEEFIKLLNSSKISMKKQKLVDCED